MLWDRNSDVPIARGGRSIGHATSNEAEWQALVDGFQAAKDRGATKVVAYTDSQLVVHQFNGEWKIRDERMYRYARNAQSIAKQIGDVEVRFVYRQILHLADRAAQEHLRRGGQR